MSELGHVKYNEPGISFLSRKKCSRNHWTGGGEKGVICQKALEPAEGGSP